MAAFTCTFQTHVYSRLPPSFSRGFKELVAFTFKLTSMEEAPQWLLKLFPPPPGSLRPDPVLWKVFEELGLIERYESLILSVCYEHIEDHILKTYAKTWDARVLQELRDWMSREIVPWLVMPYAREAKTRTSASFSIDCV